jgi:hypothetical protein
MPDSTLAGGFFLVVGAFNLPFAKATGSRAHNQLFRRPIAGWFWRQCGERGAQLLYLGIAVILITAGCVLLAYGNEPT